jgi:ankyrin repeat protein
MVEQALIPASGAKGEELANASNVSETQSGGTEGQEQENPYIAFFLACLNGDLAAARALLAPGMDVNYHSGAATALHCAACNGHAAVVRFLLDQGASVDPRMGYVSGDLAPYLEGATPLILAIANRENSVAELLLARGANPREKTHQGYTGKMMREILGAARIPHDFCF